jgi:hypothetical protein
VRTLFTVIVLDIKYEPVDYYVVLLFYGFHLTEMFWNKIFHRIKFSIILAGGFIFPRFCPTWLNQWASAHPMVGKS